jgi:hypothetical protein
MKKLFVNLSCIFVLVLVLKSCSFKEKIYVNADGSGSMSFHMDASQLMKLAGDEFAESDKSFDSIMDFKTLLDEKRDSIAGLPADQQAKLKALEKFRLKMKMIPEEEEMSFTLMTDFNKASELTDMFSEMSNLQGLGDTPNPEDQPLAALSGNSSSAVTYNFEDNVFKRNVEVIDRDLLNAQIDSIGEMEMFFQSSTYKLEYHFFKPVKSVSDSTAFFSQDRKTVTVERNFMEYLKNPESFNIEFVLED